MPLCTTKGPSINHCMRPWLGWRWRAAGQGHVPLKTSIIYYETKAAQSTRDSRGSTWLADRPASQSDFPAELIQGRDEACPEELWNGKKPPNLQHLMEGSSQQLGESEKFQGHMHNLLQPGSAGIPPPHPRYVNRRIKASPEME